MSPQHVFASVSRALTSSVALGCVITCLNTQAAPVEFTLSEGYVNDTLSGQPALSPQWLTVGGVSSFYVDSSADGKIVMNVGQTATQNSIWQTPANLTLAPAATTAVDFVFTQNPTPSSASVLGLNWFINPSSGNSNVYAFFGRDTVTDRYKIGFYQNNGSPATYVAVNVSGSSIGLNSAASDNTSDPLRLSYLLTRGATETNWQATMTLTNLATSAVVATATTPAFATSAAFFSDTTIYPTISSLSLQSGGLTALNILAFRPPGGAIPPELPGMTLTFNDEFEGTALDLAKWSPHYCKPATINSEAQAYLPDSFEFSGTALRIRSDARSFGGKSYTSGAMTSFGRFAQTYGYFEMRAKVQEGRGLWPAFWLLPQNQSWPPEIDILELLGEDPRTAHQTLHFNDPAKITAANPTGKTASGKAYTGPDFSREYHTYAVSWRPEAMIFYIDGIERHRITSFIPAIPMYILANTALGGTWPVEPDFTTPFPAYFDIDYIRAYKYNDLPAQPPLSHTYGRTTVTPSTVSPGQTITVTSSAVIGNAAISRLSIHMLIKDFWGTTQYSDTYQYLDNNPANSTRPFTFTYTVPANLPPGLYNVGFTMVNSANSQNAAIGLAARFTVGNPLPPLPPAPIFPNPAPLVLSGMTISNVSGQGAATHTFVNSGLGIRIQGNGWKVTDLNYTVTSKTWLEFEISANTVGEAYSIGLLPTAAYDNTTLNNYAFQIVGNQTLGRQHFNTYSVETGGAKRYRIPVGGFYTGPITKLLFVNDMDAAPTGDVTFSNVKIYEGP
jgi:beta-glucanase (GH16 family)